MVVKTKLQQPIVIELEKLNVAFFEKKRNMLCK